MGKKINAIRKKMASAIAPPQNEKVTTNQLIKLLGLEGVDTDSLSEVTYYTCMKILCESIGKLPYKIVQKEYGKGSRVATDHDLYPLLRYRPNKFMTATDFWTHVEFNRNHYGNCYVWISGYGKQMQLYILPNEYMQVWVDNKLLLSNIKDIYYICNADGKRYVFKSEEILHFKTSITKNGIVGLSVREQLESTILGNAKAQTMLNKLYDNGFTSKAVLQYTGDLNDDLALEFTKQIENYASGRVDSVKNIIPIPIGSQLTALNTKLADNQFIELKQYSALQIASAFGIKPSQINDFTKSSYASGELQQLSFLVDTLLYTMKGYEEETTYKLLSSDDISKGYKAKFNEKVLLRVDSKTQMEYLKNAVNNFIMTTNEARDELDFPFVEGGDVLLGNGNTIPITMVGMQYSKKEGD